jgi:hypothetical protein
MPVARKLPPLPRSDVPVIDPQTGKMNDAWYRFFFELLLTLEEMRGLIP